MFPARRDFLVSLAALTMGCSRRGTPIECRYPPPPSAEKRGAFYLLGRQSMHGAWRSDVYGQFKDGTALTPLVLHALRLSGGVGGSPMEKGVGFLKRFVGGDGTLRPPEYGFEFPIYTASLGLIEMHAAGEDVAPWLRYLRGRQLTEELGWKPEDPEYGGWGYCRAVPRKPKPGEFSPPLIESNLSATVFALEALRAAGVPSDDPAYASALVFVNRCQNYSETPSRIDDGGFHFIDGDPVRNKAGVAGVDAAGRSRYHSYGSMTADGLRALLLCGMPKSDARVRAARGWLREHFRADRHPGEYAPAHEGSRDAVYYYYAASVARALAVVSERGDERATDLRAALAGRQNEDGSWRNPVEMVREDDPIVATSFALMAFSACE